MRLLLKLLISTASVFLAAYIIPGVSVESVFTAFVVSVVLGILNVFLKPILIILTLPVTIITFGLFAWIINVLLIMLAGNIVPGFLVDGFWAALLFGLTLSLVSSFLNWLAK